MRIAMIQMEVKAGDKDRNISHARTMLTEAAAKADVLVLPEMWTVGYDFRHLDEQACMPGDELLVSLEEWAVQHKKYVVAGSLPTRESGQLYNRSYLYGPQGELGSYDKLHLFSLLAEPRRFAAGNRMTLVRMGDMTVGSSICYDVRFPEMYRRMAADGADLVVIPAEWPTTRLEAWNCLVRARAMENQIYVCAVNAVGTYRGNVFAGHSCLIAPDGEYIARAGSEETIIYGIYEGEKLKTTRAHMSVWQDRRTDIYGDVKE